MIKPTLQDILDMVAILDEQQVPTPRVAYITESGARFLCEDAGIPFNPDKNNRLVFPASGVTIEVVPDYE